MNITRHVVVFDARDIATESAFWAGLLGGRVVPDDGFHCVLDADARWVIGVQLAPDHEPPDWPHSGEQQAHLDIHVDDLAAAHELVLSLGGRLLQPSADPTADEGFQVYADPAGHPFCLGFGQPSEDAVRRLAERLAAQD